MSDGEEKIPLSRLDLQPLRVLVAFPRGPCTAMLVRSRNAPRFASGVGEVDQVGIEPTWPEGRLFYRQVPLPARRLIRVCR